MIEIGKKYNMLTCLGRDTRKNYMYYLFKCDCGTVKSLRYNNVECGSTKSCGCHKKNNKFHQTHGKTHTRLYNIYTSMKYRCYYPKHKSYIYYGAKGVTICKEWLDDFMNFYNWAIENGYRDDLTIDRIDVEGDYEPGNCRWATREQQANNKSVTIYITYNGKTHTISEWSKLLKIKHDTIYARLKRGHDIEDVLKPIRR